MTATEIIREMDALPPAELAEVVRHAMELGKRRPLSGADLTERKGMSDDAVRARRVKAFAAYDSIERMPMPTIAVAQTTAMSTQVAPADFLYQS